MDKQSEIYKLKHSAAHLLAHAVKEIWPSAKLTLGPATETGFFYDFYLSEPLKESDLEKIEQKMREIAKRDLKIEGRQVSKKEALELYKDNEFKSEIIEGIEDETVGIYSQGDFFDLCEGGHIDSTKNLKHFKLMSVAGSYWRADRENAQLQRVYGVIFSTKDELFKYLKRIEEAKKYDHRVIGKKLDLFSFHEEAPGMPFFHDKGLKIFNKLIEHARKLQDEDGYQEIQTPLILNENLWKTSGHYDNYKEHMYFTSTEHEKSTNVLRPMNCPPGILIYKSTPHSYKEFPMKVAEFGKCHRFELSGVLHGLMRVRSFTMDDAHIFCTPEQISKEVEKVLILAEKTYKPFGFSKITMGLSTKPEKHIGSDQLWETATEALKTALENRKEDFVINEGDGAFYGPKIEIILEDTMGREWQCGTVQVDFFLPENFKLEYIDSDQSRKRPVMIHRAIYGSLERFMGILLEHYKGRLPFWLSPIQARVLTITEKQSSYAFDLYEKLKKANMRCEIDNSGDKINAQIRRSQLDQIPWMLVLGAKEEENKTITLRNLEGKQQFGLTVEELLQKAEELICEEWK
ncbi:threonine--tRNA ligase [Candidatus Dependentiae bacterium]